MTVAFTIDGVKVEAEAGDNVLDTSRRYGFEVPSLCHHEAVVPYGACRMCLVEITKGKRRKITTSCNYEVLPGIEVRTDTPEIRRHRAMVIELILAEAPDNKAVRELAAEYGVTKPRFKVDAEEARKREGCILCGLCARACTEIVGVSAITFRGRGDGREMGTPFLEEPKACIACGACAWVCPTSCIRFVEEDGVRKVVRWGRELPLAKDESGRPIAPQYQLFHFRKITKDLPKDIFKKAPGER
jgi:NADH dehydrogenase/NADH:ubiquinone oxidoreductase subunit G